MSLLDRTTSSQLRAINFDSKIRLNPPLLGSMVCGTMTSQRVKHLHMFCIFSGLTGAIVCCGMTDWSRFCQTFPGDFLPECTAVTAIELLSFT